MLDSKHSRDKTGRRKRVVTHHGEFKLDLLCIVASNTLLESLVQGIIDRLVGFQKVPNGRIGVWHMVGHEGRLCLSCRRSHRCSCTCSSEHTVALGRSVTARRNPWVVNTVAESTGNYVACAGPGFIPRSYEHLCSSFTYRAACQERVAHCHHSKSF